jgi:hypothetical protein
MSVGIREPHRHTHRHHCGERSYWIAFAVTGIAVDWYCAFEWFRGEYSFWSGTVLHRTALIVLSCTALGCLATLLPPRKWQIGVLIFFWASAQVSYFQLMSSIAHR